MNKTGNMNRTLRVMGMLGALAAVSAGRVLAQGWSEPRGDEVVRVPALEREMRGVWVASVANIDWPSKKGLTSAEQQAEAVAILDRAVEVGLNTIVLQVRPSCDALYRSEIEPWSEFLTGESGKGPSAAYDPLEWWVNEAHKRGLELHAWFNPFRARHFEAKGPDAGHHISKTRPDLVRSYDNYLWLDPGEAEAREHSLRVMLDVVKRYDIDAVHLDDYFYPYPKTVNGKEVPFPDDVPFERYVSGGGRLARGDWRRENINGFMRDLYAGVRAIKPQVRVGISPFGIWRPGYPSMVKGFDAYEKLAADAPVWMKNGWLDYCVPQLYWKVEAPQQPFGPLLAWWRGENTLGRHLYAGLNAANVGKTEKAWPASEIARQIEITRNTADSDGGAATGTILFSAKTLRDETLARTIAGSWNGKAITPAMEWLGAEMVVEQPVVGVKGTRDEPTIEWTLRDPAEYRWVSVMARKDAAWSTMVLPAGQRFAAIDSGADAIAVRTVDRAGRASEPVVLIRR